MTAATVAAPLCPVCRHPTRRHDDTGCSADDGYCVCMLTRATLAVALDELAALDVGVSTDVHAPAEPAPTDSPAGAVDAVTEVAPCRPVDDLPGTTSAPVDIGHGPAAPPAATPAVEALDPPRASTAGLGQLLGSYITWWCPRHLTGHELPGEASERCCKGRLLRARVTIRKEPADG